MNQINPILFEKKPINRTKIRHWRSKKQLKPDKCPIKDPKDLHVCNINAMLCIFQEWKNHSPGFR